MNIRISSVLSGFGAIIAFMSLFPPFQFVTGQGVKLNLGYAFILTPPQYRSGLAYVDIPVLLTQIFCAALIFGSLYFAATFSENDINNT